MVLKQAILRSMPSLMHVCLLSMHQGIEPKESAMMHSSPNFQKYHAFFS